MNLPKIKNKKLITKDFIELAKKVRESLDEELKYLEEKKKKYGTHISSHLDFVS